MGIRTLAVTRFAFYVLGQYLVDRQRRLSHLPCQPLRNFKGEEILILLGAFPGEDSLYLECVLACLHKHGGEPIIGKNLVDTGMQWPSKRAAGLADREMCNVVECEGSEANRVYRRLI